MRHRSSPRHGLRWLFLAVAPVASGASHASFFAGEALDQAADILAWVIIVLVPLLGITLFWLIHILPEKIAHKRHHPQLDGIKTLCLLSLVFGGLLWPIAWLWAYTRPAGYKLAYGTDKHENYFTELGARARAGSLDEHEMLALRADLAAMAAKGSLSPGLIVLREDLDRLGAPATGAPPAPAAAAVPATVPTSPAGTQS